MIKGWKKLTKEERKHLNNSGCRHISQFQRTINEQHKQRLENPNVEPCFECKWIAEKLEIKPEEVFN